MTEKYSVRLVKAGRDDSDESSTSHFSSEEDDIKEEKFEVPEDDSHSEEPAVEVTNDGRGNRCKGGVATRIRRLRIQVIRLANSDEQAQARNQKRTHTIRKREEETKKEEPTKRLFRTIKRKYLLPPVEEELESVKAGPMSKPHAKRRRILTEEMKKRKRERRKPLTLEQKKAQCEYKKFRRKIANLAKGNGDGKVDQVSALSAAEIEKLKQSQERANLLRRGRRAMLKLASEAKKELQSGGLDDPTQLIKSFTNEDLEALRAHFEWRKRKEKLDIDEGEDWAVSLIKSMTTDEIDRLSETYERTTQRTPEQKKARAERKKFKCKLAKLAKDNGDGKLDQVSAAEIEQFKRSEERTTLLRRGRRALWRLAAAIKEELESGGLEDPTQLIKSIKNEDLEALRAQFEWRKQQEKLETDAGEDWTVSLIKSMTKDEIDILSEKYERQRLTDGLKYQKAKQKRKLNRMTKEELQLEKWYSSALARRRKMSAEQLAQPDPKFDELEAARFKAVEIRRRRKHNLPEMTEEVRKKWIEEEKEKAEKKRLMNLKRREQMTEEEREQLKLRNYIYRANRSAYYNPPEDEKEARRELSRQWRHTLTGEQLERYRDSVKKAGKKHQEKIKQNPELLQKFKDKNNARNREKTQNETAEERQKRLLRYRLYQSRKLMRKKLREEGLSEEEVQAKVQEYTENFYAEHQITRPRPGLKGRTRTLGLGGGIYKDSVTGLSYLPPLSNILSGISLTTSSTEIEMPTSAHATRCEPEPNEDDDNLDNNNAKRETSEHRSPTPSPAPSLDGDHHLDDPDQDDFDDEEDISYNNVVTDPDPLDEDEGEPTTTEGSTSTHVQVSKDLRVVPPQIAKEKEIRADDEPPSNSQRPKSKRNDEFSQMCADCGRVFSYRSTYYAHRRIAHLAPRKCPHPQCDFLYREGRQLWVHFRQIHVQSEVAVECVETVQMPKKRKFYNCPRADCDFTYKEQKQLWVHFRQVHLKDEVAPASLNLAGFENGSNLTKDKDKPKSKEPSICPECGKIFKTKCYLSDHIRRFHEGKGFFCDICENGSDLQSAAKLWRHKVAKHGMSDLEPPPNIEVITCEFCGEKILRGYAQHILKKHPEMKDRLPSPTSTSKDQEEHLSQLGLPGLRITCHICSKTYKNKHSMNRHLRQVHGIGKQTTYLCPYCGRSFKRNYIMNLHAVGCHGKSDVGRRRSRVSRNCVRSKRFSCVLCGEKFFKRNDLRQHVVATHAKEYESIENPDTDKIPLECKDCSESFSDLDQLRKHLESTHPEQSLKCPECEQVMLSSVELALHISLGHNKKRDAKEKRIKVNRKTTASSRRRNSTAGDGRRKGRKRRRVASVALMEDVDEDSDGDHYEDELQNVVVPTPTMPPRRSLRNGGSKRSYTSVVTPPCFVRLKRMSNEEIISYLFRQ